MALVCSVVIYNIIGNFKDRQRTAAVSDSGTESEVSAQMSRNEEETQIQDDIISYSGKDYIYNKDIESILFMGIDKQGEVVLKDTPGTAGQADSIMLLVTDKADKSFRILQVSRESMVDVDVYDVSGEYYTSVEAQINMQYAYGNGEERSCWLMKNKVSELLFGLPIKGYVSMNISAIPILNDAVGKVTLTVPEDYTDIDPAFTKGAELTLSGEQAERYVRGRNVEVSGSNNQRMERQLQYIASFVQQASEKISGGGSLADQILSKVDSYVVTDMTADELKEASQYTYRAEENEIVPGKVVQGDEYDEYYVDDDALYASIIKMFYKEIE